MSKRKGNILRVPRIPRDKLVETPQSSRVANTPSNNTPVSSISYWLLAISRPKILLLLILGLSFLGFLDATYLAILGFTRALPPCTVTHGCERVLTSQFAYIGPIPIAVIGVGYFVFMMVLSLQLLQKFQANLVKLLFILASAAFVAGIGLVYIQAGILKAFCQYCLAAEFLMTCVFILTLLLYRNSRSAHSH